MGTQTRIRTEPAMIQPKLKPKFINIQIKFKFLNLKIQNPNRSIESDMIYEYRFLKKAIHKSLNTT